MKRILEDYTVTNDGKIYDKEGIEVDTFINSCGYVAAVLNGYIVTVAYIVAKLYVSNPNGCICITYKDGDYTNIKADNLEWYYEGEEEGKDRSRSNDNVVKENKAPTKKGVVLQIDIDGKIIATYKNTEDVAKHIGNTQTAISNNCRKKTLNRKTKTFFVYKFEYSDELVKQMVDTYKQQQCKKPAPNKKRIFKIDYNTFEILEIFDGIGEAAEKLNRTYSKINNVLQGLTMQLEECFLIREKEYNTKTIKAKVENTKQKVENSNILMFDNNANLLKQFYSMNDAVNELGYSYTTINRILTGELKQRNEFYLIRKGNYNVDTIIEEIANAKRK